MSKQKRKTTVKEKLQKWIEKNPNGYLEKSYETIGKEIGASNASVCRNLPKLIAERDACLPSKVIEKREANGFKYGKSRQLSTENINEIQHLSKFHSPHDIAYIMELDIRTVKKYLEERKEKTEQ